MSPKITPKDLKKLFVLNLADFFFLSFHQSPWLYFTWTCSSLSSSLWGVKWNPTHCLGLMKHLSLPHISINNSALPLTKDHIFKRENKDRGKKKINAEVSLSEEINRKKSLLCKSRRNEVKQCLSQQFWANSFLPLCPHRCPLDFVLPASTALLWLHFGVRCAKSAKSSTNLEISLFLQLENHNPFFWWGWKSCDPCLVLGSHPTFQLGMFGRAASAPCHPRGDSGASAQLKLLLCLFCQALPFICTHNDFASSLQEASVGGNSEG